MGITYINGLELTLEQLIQVARFNSKVRLTEEAKKRIIDSRMIVDTIEKENRIVYGITTGFGNFSNVTISTEDCKRLQRNLILSHACGTGQVLSREATRAIMLLRVNALAIGYSGIRLETVQTLVDMINNKVHPVIFEKGSLGASGDLAPLSHMVLPMIGEGKAEYKGKVLEGKVAMERAGVPIIELVSKEGLALINGTQVMTGIGALTVYDCINLLKVSDIAASLTVEALRGIKDAFDIRNQVIRPHKGQLTTAENILKLINGSTFVTKQGELRIQDAYSLRCLPQVHGASKDAVNYVVDKVIIEMNSVTDNPTIFENGDVVSGGNFHGQPMALSFDFLAIAIAELANISERRLERLINCQLNDLPSFLINKGGLNSGFMITQYAAASLVSENKVLSHPASVDSIPSSGNQEDHVSMGTIAARKSREIFENVKRVIATEILAACQAIDFREGLSLGKGTLIAYKVVREKIKFITEDKIMYEDLDIITKLITNNELLKAVEKEIELKY